MINYIESKISHSPIYCYYIICYAGVKKGNQNVSDSILSEIENYIFSIWGQSFDQQSEWEEYIEACQEDVLNWTNDPELVAHAQNTAVNKIRLINGITPSHISHLENFVGQLIQLNSLESTQKGVQDILADAGLSESEIQDMLDSSTTEPEPQQNESEAVENPDLEAWYNFSDQQRERGQTDEVFEMLGTLMSHFQNMLDHHNLPYNGPSFSKNGISYFAETKHRKKLFCYIEATPGKGTVEIRKIYRTEEQEEFESGNFPLPNTLKLKERNGYFIISGNNISDFDGFWEGLGYLIHRNYVRIIEGKTI